MYQTVSFISDILYIEALFKYKLKREEISLLVHNSQAAAA